MATEKQIKARKRNFVRFYFLGVLTMIKKIRSGDDYDVEFNLALDQILVSLEVITSKNSGEFVWKPALATDIMVKDMSNEHIANCISLLERGMVFTKPIERMKWVTIFKTELIKRNTAHVGNIKQ